MKRTRRSTFSPTTERRAVLYARYSSTLQSDSWSIDAQLAELRAHCQRCGWSVLEETCLDEAISGSTSDRPGLERAMALIREGAANVLVVHKLDRFFRDIVKTFEYVRELEDYGAALVCTQQPIDTTNPISGKIILAVMASLAEVYLDNLSEETAKGKRARAAAGLPNGVLPYGYQLVEKAERGASNRAIAAIVPHEADAVREAYRLYTTGQYGDAAIARLLNIRGYRFRSRGQGESGRFTKDTMRVMLSNPFYIGMVVQPTQSENASWSIRLASAPRVRGMHEPIIDDALFEAAQQRRALRRGNDATGNGRKGREQQSPHAPYLARGIVRCAKCKHRLRGQGGAGRIAHYRCGVSSRGGICPTERKSLPAATVDRLLFEAVTSITMRKNWRKDITRALDDGESGVERVQEQRASLERKLTRIRQLLIDEDIEQREYRTERARLEAERDALAPPAALVTIERAATQLESLRGVWGIATNEQRRGLALQAISAMYCDPDAPLDVEVQLHPDFAPLRSAMNTCTQRVTDGARYRFRYTTVSEPASKSHAS